MMFHDPPGSAPLRQTKRILNHLNNSTTVTRLDYLSSFYQDRLFEPAEAVSERDRIAENPPMRQATLRLSLAKPKWDFEIQARLSS